MSATHASLDAAASERKARLAKLASLKRKQPDSEPSSATGQVRQAEPPEAAVADAYLSGRNYDTATKTAKLGFENNPAADEITIEEQANLIAASAAEQAAKDELEIEKGIDLFKLQPKKPNWDLKRDLAEKMKVLDVRTQNAIARLVRERIQNAKKEALEKDKSRGHTSDDGQEEEVGIEGNALVESVHLREKEEQENERREQELEAEEYAVS